MHIEEVARGVAAAFVEAVAFRGFDQRVRYDLLNLTQRVKALRGVGSRKFKFSRRVYRPTTIFADLTHPLVSVDK